MGTQVKGDSHRATRGTNNQVRGSMETGGGTGQRALVLILAHLLSLLLQRYSLANPFLLVVTSKVSLLLVSSFPASHD